MGTYRISTYQQGLGAQARVFEENNIKEELNNRYEPGQGGSMF